VQRVDRVAPAHRDGVGEDDVGGALEAGERARLGWGARRQPGADGWVAEFDRLGVHSDPRDDPRRRGR
jgi:hypothetical protein